MVTIPLKSLASCFILRDGRNFTIGGPEHLSLETRRKLNLWRFDCSGWQSVGLSTQLAIRTVASSNNIDFHVIVTKILERKCFVLLKLKLFLSKPRCKLSPRWAEDCSSCLPRMKNFILSRNLELWLKNLL